MTFKTCSQGEVILGDILTAEILAIPIKPSPTSLFGPRSACLLSATGPLWVSDTGHHRLLGWQNIPTVDSQPADWVIGQPDFYHEGQNAKGKVTNSTFSVPTGLCKCGNGLVLADAWNHRVLIWNNMPTDSHVPADIVLGQGNFHDNQPNGGKQLPAANSLHWPYGVFYHEGRLFVADTGNRRLLIWQQLPTENAQPADIVLGQPDMISRNENGGGSPTAASMRWCHDITLWANNLVVADAGNNRVMIWQGIPTSNNQPCAVVLGQRDFNSVEMNQGVYLPNASSLSMPYGVAVAGDWLLVADTANSRLLAWEQPSSLLSLQGSSAINILGQQDFESKGENRNFKLPQRDTLNWCYGVKVCGDWAVIADSGNNRVLLWQLRDLLREG